jgi:alpha-amylase/alpha-mannosidase (GH57 family)
MSVETLKSVVSEILDNNVKICSGQLFYGDFQMEESSWDDQIRKHFRSQLNEKNISATLIDRHGGEGEGDDYWSVYSFTDGTDTVYVKFQGWYASFVGSEFTDYFFVAPREITMVVFDAVEVDKL